jgi:hypothetical protein
MVCWNSRQVGACAVCGAVCGAACATGGGIIIAAGGGGGDTMQPAHAKLSAADAMVNVRLFMGSPSDQHYFRMARSRRLQNFG